MNMAIDEALLRRASTSVLRIYGWARPAVSFGYFLKHDAVAAQWPARELVRRWTGGGVVPHGEDLTYTLVVPRSDRVFDLSAPESYRAIHAAVSSALGDSAALAQSAAEQKSNACFENPAQFDVMLSGRKVAGAAQRRTKYGLLHQGSIQCGSLADALRERLGSAFAEDLLPFDFSAELAAEAEGLSREKYATEAWLRRW